MRKNAMWVLITVVGSQLTLSQLAWAQAPRVGKQDPTGPGKSGDQTVQSAAKPIDPSVGVSGLNPNSYIMGGEDIISITTWRVPDFTFTRALRPDGKISIPLVGELTAAGKTPSDFEQELSKALKDYVQNPVISVTVLEVRSKKYFIIGEVLRAGSFPLVGPITVMEALSQSGFAPFANKKKIRILRGTETRMFNFEEVAKGKKMEQNVPLENGDYVIVK